MPQKKCVTIYGYSDDLVEIENSQYKEDEIDCYDKAIRFFFVDGTIISICYLTPPTIEIVGFLGDAARFITKPCLKQRVMRFPTVRYGCSV